MYLTWAGFCISKGNYHSVFRGRGQDGKGNKDTVLGTVEQMGISEIRLKDRHNLRATCLQML